MLLVALVACHTLEKVPLADADASPEGVCGEPIHVPTAGWVTDDPVPADVHAETYGDAPTPRHVHLSWAYEPATTMSFVWRTDADTLASRVELGLDTTYGTTIDGASFFVGTDPADGRVHEAHACELTPGTTYHYRVGGPDAWSDDFTFTTPPAPGEDAAFRFAVAGDARDNQATWALLLDALAERAPDFLLFSGDAVDIGVNMDEWDAWLDAGEGHLASMPVLMAHGNHEFQAQNYYALFAQPGNEQWFAFTWGPARFFFLNDTVAETSDIDAQAAWLEAGLAETDARWRFAVHHKPAYSSCTTHGSDLSLREAWSPIEEAGGVVVDFTGHNHNYERSVPLYGGAEVAAREGTTYVVTAGAGADLYGNDLSQPFTAKAEIAEHYVIADVSGDTLALTAYDLAGNVLDTFSTTR